MVHENNAEKCALLSSAFPQRWLTYSLDSWRHPQSWKEWELLQQKCKEEKEPGERVLTSVIDYWSPQQKEVLKGKTFELEKIHQEKVDSEKSWGQPSSIQDIKILPEYNTGKGNKKIQMILPPVTWNDHWDLEGVKSGMGHGLREGAEKGAPYKGTKGKGKETATKDHSPPVQWVLWKLDQPRRPYLNIPGGTDQHLARNPHWLFMLSLMPGGTLLVVRLLAHSLLGCSAEEVRLCWAPPPSWTIPTRHDSIF